MGSRRIIVILAIVFIEGYDVAAQCGRVEYLNQPSLATAPTIQPISQFIVPAVIKPILTPEQSPEPAPVKPDYTQNPYPPMSMPPPIIYKEDDDDWQHLLYFLILAMKNRGGFGGYSAPPYAFYPVPVDFGNSKFGCDNMANNNMNYIPYPIAVPGAGGQTDNLNIGDDISILQSPSMQVSNGRDNEVTLLIRTE